MALLEILLGLALGFTFGYLTSYYKEKGKNAALLTDISKLEKAKAEIQLDRDKRKYQYESKKEQYIKYFNTLDDLSAKSGKEIYETFLPMIEQFYQDFTNAKGDKDLELKAVTNLSNQSIKLLTNAGEDHGKMKRETSSIRLIASPTVLEILQELESTYEKMFDLTADMLRSMSQNLILNNQQLIQEQQNNINQLGELAITFKENLINEVRKELDEI